MKSLANEQRYWIKIIVYILVIGFFVGFLFIYQDGLANGQGTLTLKDGTKYEGEFKDHKFIGESGD